MYGIGYGIGYETKRSQIWMRKTVNKKKGKGGRGVKCYNVIHRVLFGLVIYWPGEAVQDQERPQESAILYSCYGLK